MKPSKRILLPIAAAATLIAGVAVAEGPVEGNEVFHYQAEMSRADVHNEQLAAEDAGLIVRGEALAIEEQTVADAAALMNNSSSPSLMSPVSTAPLSRDQVQAEAAEAYRLGLVAQGEVMPDPTAAQVEQVRMAGARAVGGPTVVQYGQTNVIVN